MTLGALGTVNNKAAAFTRVAEKDIKRIVEPSGLHFKNNSIKAFLNANFYQPKADELNRYAEVVDHGNQTLFDKINPFKSIIANFAKANNKKVHITLAKVANKNDVVAFSYTALNEGKIAFPAGASVSVTKPSDSKRDALEKIYSNLREIVSGEKLEQFYLTTKNTDIDIKPFVLKK